jgi:hypothetical protein
MVLGTVSSTICAISQVVDKMGGEKGVQTPPKNERGQTTSVTKRHTTSSSPSAPPIPSLNNELAKPAKHV